jgi:hypothetical protein
VLPSTVIIVFAIGLLLCHQFAPHDRGARSSYLIRNPEAEQESACSHALKKSH